MDMQHIAHKLSETWRAFRWDRRGNVAIIFAFAIFPLLGFVGVAVDYSRANAAKVKLQAAMDAAGLMLAKDPNLSTMTDDQRNTKAKAYFDAMFKVKDANFGLERVNVVYDGNKRKMDITASATIPNTPFYNSLHRWATWVESRTIDNTYQGQMTIGATSTVKWGSRLRVAMALDTTGSMEQDGKITSMKNAVAGVGGAIDQLKALNVNDGDVYISFVPFAVHINAGSANYTHDDWIDWTQWEAPPATNTTNAVPRKANIGPGSNCPWSNSQNGYTCMDRQATASGSTGTSTVPSSGSYKAWVCPSVDSGGKIESRGLRYYNGCYKPGWDCTGSSCTCSGNPDATCSCTGSGSSKYCRTEYVWQANAHSTWGGCIMDRNDAAGNPPTTSTSTGPDQTVDVPGPKYPADQYALTLTNGTVGCSNNNQVRSLANDWDNMKTFVNNLVTGGATNQPVGLVWAWQSLGGGGPLVAPAKTAGYDYDEVIILLSDGWNTQDRWWGNGFSSGNPNYTKVDDRMYNTNGTAGTCKNIKTPATPGGKVPMIYTVQVDTGGDGESAVLRNCASRPFDTALGKSTFYRVTQANAIPDTFQQIVRDISKLRVAQ